MEAGWRPDSSNLGASLAEICACSCLAFVGGRPSCQFFNLSSLASPRAKPGILRSQPCSDSRKINRRLTLRKPERRKSQRLLCRRNPGRDSDALIQDRRSEGHLAYIHATLLHIRIISRTPGRSRNLREAVLRAACSLISCKISLYRVNHVLREFNWRDSKHFAIKFYLRGTA